MHWNLLYACICPLYMVERARKNKIVSGKEEEDREWGGGEGGGGHALGGREKGQRSRQRKRGRVCGGVRMS
jgi:hypothetical protein